MRKIVQVFTIVIMVFLTSCGGGASSSGDNNGGSQDRVTPDHLDGGVVNDEVGTSLMPNIVLRFSTPVDLTTANQNTIYLSTTANGSDKIIVGNIVANEDHTVLHFAPTASLIEKTKYYIIVTNQVKSFTGVSYNTSNSMSFTTGDFTAPNVSILSPSNHAQNISRTPSIQLNFSEAVKNVNSTTVTLHKGSFDGEVVAIGNITQGANDVYTFSPEVELAEKTTYYIILSNGVTDLSDNKLVATQFSFTTGDLSIPVATMLSPSNNAINISRTTSIQLKFSEVVQGVNSSSVVLHKDRIDGEVVAIGNILQGGDNIYTFSPVTSLNENTNYYVTISNMVRDENGNNLVNTVFLFTTGDFTAPTVSISNPSNNATNVSRSPSIQLQFSEAVKNVSPITVTLHKDSPQGQMVTVNSVTQGSDNIYTLSPNVELAEKTTYYIVFSDAITDLSDNKLAETEFSFTTGDFSVPTVTILSPGNNAINISRTPSIQLQFSEAVQNINSSSVVLHKGSIDGGVVSLNNIVQSDNNTYTFSPTNPLVDDTVYYLVVSDEVQDDSGNKLVTAVFSFTTGDFITPTVMILAPSNNATNVSRVPNIQIQFSEVVQNVNSTTVTVHKGSVDGETVAIGDITKGANNIYSFDVASPLTELSTYYVVISNGVVDMSNNPLNLTAFNFTVGDFTSPMVTMLSPINNAINISKTPNIQLQFNEAVENVTPETISVHKGEANGEIVAINSIVKDANNIYSFNLMDPLDDQTIYYVLVSDQVVDMFNNPVTAPTQFNFTTGDFTAPTALILSPSNNAINVSKIPNIQFQFSEAVIDVNTNNVTLHKGNESGEVVPISNITRGDNHTYTFNVSSDLISNTKYYIVLGNGIKDLHDNSLAKTVFNFTTGDLVAPTVSILSPNDNATNTTNVPNIKVQFSKTVKNINSSTVKLRAGSITGTEIAINNIVESANDVYTFSPLASLNKNTKYYVVLSNGISTLSDIPLSQTSYSFTTAESIVLNVNIPTVRPGESFDLVVTATPEANLVINLPSGFTTTDGQSSYVCSANPTCSKVIVPNASLPAGYYDITINTGSDYPVQTRTLPVSVLKNLAYSALRDARQIQLCNVTESGLRNCRIASSAFVERLYGILVSPNGKYAYVFAGDGGVAISSNTGIFKCAINQSTYALSNCVLQINNQNPREGAITSNGKYLYYMTVPDRSIRRCTINSSDNSLGSCQLVQAFASGTWGAILTMNSANTTLIANVEQSGSYVCPMNPETGLLSSSCTKSSAIASNINIWAPVFNNSGTKVYYSLPNTYCDFNSTTRVLSNCKNYGISVDLQSGIMFWGSDSVYLSGSGGIRRCNVNPTTGMFSNCVVQSQASTTFTQMTTIIK